MCVVCWTACLWPISRAWLLLGGDRSLGRGRKCKASVILELEAPVSAGLQLRRRREGSMAKRLATTKRTLGTRLSLSYAVLG